MKLAGSSAAFRVDASQKIGTGHMMRSLTLADGLRSAGMHCKFLSKPGPGDMLNSVRSRGYDVYPLSAHAEADSSNSVPLDWAADSRESSKALGATPIDLLICDHYGIDCRWESSLRDYCARIMVVDDLADRRHDCDLLLDQNLGRAAADYADRVPQGSAVFAGSSYALLRPQFSRDRDRSLARRAALRGQFRRLMISMGGADEPNATREVLVAMSTVAEVQTCEIDVVVGAASPWLEDIRRLSADLPMSITVHCNVADMAALMVDCDLAIGASGATSWERCCLGVPTLIVVLADNQWPGARALAAAGAAVILGELSDIANLLPAAIANIAVSDSLLQEMSAASARVADGLGVDRVIAGLEQL
jgi:UDP-2,4-diacetamido-2,4,6-trideoxy-beta-L-altropyranose hydrolase